MKPQFKFYATLLDAFQGYIGSSEIWQQYWGNSSNPSKTEDEFEQEQFQSLIDRINRVPFESEPADRGTAFNEVIDCIMLKCKSDKMEIKTDLETNSINVGYKTHIFSFPISVCKEFANYYKGGIPQVYTEGVLSTSYGDVLLYGYIDTLMPHCVHDIKTTGKYTIGKYRSNWQHLVYPYCLQQDGNNISEFEYNIAQIDKKSGMIETFTEQYVYRTERDISLLQSHCEMFIDFLNYNKDLITNKKIFGLEQ